MAKVGVVTVLRDTKGTASYAVDLGGETPVAVILLTNRHDPANGTAGTAYSSVEGPEEVVGFATAAPLYAMNKMIIQDANSVQSSNTRYETARLYYTGGTFSQDWEVFLSSVAADQITINWSNVPITLGHEQQFTFIVFGGSDCQVHLNNINLGTGTSALDQTGPGFEPDIVFAAHCARSATGLSSSSAGFGLFSFGIGLNDGADTQRAIGRRDGSGTLTVNRSNYAVIDNGICVSVTGGTSPSIFGHVTIGSYDASGYSVTPSANFASQILSCLAIKAPGINFSLDDYLTRTSNGTQNITGLGFQPELLVLAGGGSTTINTASGPNAANASSYIAAHYSGGDSGMYVLLSQDNVDPSNSLNYSNSDGSSLSLGSTGVDNLLAGEIAAYTSGGFDISYTTTNGTAYLFMGLAMAHVGASSAYASSRFFF